MAFPSQLILQDAASPLIEDFLYFHDHALMIVFLISTLVLYIISTTITTKLTSMYETDSQEVEIIWTVIPAVILIVIALPSIRILYLSDEVFEPHLTVKALGHQWYWSYEYTDYSDLGFDSYIVPSQDLPFGQFRLLEADHRIVVPSQTPIRILISADDVIHAWAVPALGVKIDGIPGRLNQTSFMTTRPGLFYGQCSEICGANHSFIPIVVEAVPLNTFESWIALILEDASSRSLLRSSASLLSWRRWLLITLDDMPQLCPDPWFTIFVFSWATILLVMFPKLESHTFPNEPSPQKITLLQSNPWTWSWH